MNVTVLPQFSLLSFYNVVVSLCVGDDNCLEEKLFSTIEYLENHKN